MKAIHLSRLNLYKLTTWVIENEKRLYDSRVTREEVARQAEEALGFRINVSHVNVIIQNHELNITSTRSAPKTFMKSTWNKATDERLDALEKTIEEIQDKLRRLENNLPGAFESTKQVQLPLRGI